MKGVGDVVERVSASAAVQRIKKLDAWGGNQISIFSRHLHHDHLGSVDAVTNASGAVLGEKISFDPFGGGGARATGRATLMPPA